MPKCWLAVCVEFPKSSRIVRFDEPCNRLAHSGGGALRHFLSDVIVRSPFRAKYLVVVRYRQPGPDVPITLCPPPPWTLSPSPFVPPSPYLSPSPFPLCPLPPCGQNRIGQISASNKERGLMFGSWSPKALSEFFNLVAMTTFFSNPFVPRMDKTELVRSQLLMKIKH